MKQPSETTDVMQIDIVSDIMCPWCIVAFKQLEQALALTGTKGNLRWHPFELNPQMPSAGQNLFEHMAEKYGASPAQSLENRARLKALGETLGLPFNFTEDSRIVNTFAAHQLLDWAELHGKQHPLKIALFAAHFREGLDVSDPKILTGIAASLGLENAGAVLTSGAHSQPVRDKQAFWSSRGITGVPAIIFAGKYLLTGAQGVENYAELLRKIHQEEIAA